MTPKVFLLWLVLTILLVPMAVDAALKSGRNEPLPLRYQDNPLEYRYGRVTGVALPQQNGQTITNFTFSPVGTFLLYSESVAVCGDQRAKLDFGSGDLVVIVMSKKLTRRYCHELLRIDVIEKARAAGGRIGGDL
jgi:hypothetical protein